MKGRTKLESLRLRLPGSTALVWTPVVSWKQILNELTPLSRESISAGIKKQIPLPGLRWILLGADPPNKPLGQSIATKGSYPYSLAGIDVVSLLAAREASRKGLSSGQIALIASGDLESFEEESAGNLLLLKLVAKSNL